MTDATLLPSDAPYEVRVERSFLGMDDQGTVVRLSESTILVVRGEESADGFVDVETDSSKLRVLAIDLKLRTARVKSAQR